MWSCSSVFSPSLLSVWRAKCPSRWGSGGMIFCLLRPRWRSTGLHTCLCRFAVFCLRLDFLRFWPDSGYLVAAFTVNVAFRFSPAWGGFQHGWYYLPAYCFSWSYVRCCMELTFMGLPIPVQSSYMWATFPGAGFVGLTSSVHVVGIFCTAGIEALF